MPPKLILLALSCALTLPCFSQNISKVGEANTLDIATWNIEWFGSEANGPSNDDLQSVNVEDIIAAAGIDLWGVQEIADEVDFQTMLNRIEGNYVGRLATNSGQQKIGFIYNEDVIQVRQVKHILEDFERAFAFRPPFQLEANVTLPDTTVVVTFIVLHMKAFSDLESYERRVDASIRLKNHIDFTSLSSDAVIVLGDMNDELEQSTSGSRASPYANFVEDRDHFFYPTLPIEQSGAGSFCTNSSCSSTSSMLDHIMMTDELFDAFIENSAGFIPNLTEDVNSFGSTTSDHLPVVARFEFLPQHVSTEKTFDIPKTFTLNSPPFPNPFNGTTTLSLALHSPSLLKIEVFDLLGRRVAMLADREFPTGDYQHRFTPGPLPQGVYMVRIASGNQVVTVPVTYFN